MYDWGPGPWAGMAFGMLFFWAVVVVGVVALVRYSGREQRGASRGDAAETVLRERFARGDIDDEEFRRRMATLREHR